MLINKILSNFALCIALVACSNNGSNNAKEDSDAANSANTVDSNSTTSVNTPVCPQTDTSISADSNRLSIDSYLSMQCQESTDLNGIWLAVYTSDNSTNDQGIIYQTRSSSRIITSIRELPDNQLAITECGRDEEIWHREADTWGLDTGSSFYPYGTRTIIAQSSDRLTVSEKSGYNFPIGRYSRRYTAKMEWIKIDTLDANKSYGGYTLYLNTDNINTANNLSYSIDCFRESDGESMVDASNADVYQITDPLDYPHPDELPKSSDWAPYYYLKVQGHRENNLDAGTIAITTENHEPYSAWINDKGGFSGEFEFQSSINSIEGDFSGSSGNTEATVSISMNLQ